MTLASALGGFPQMREAAGRTPCEGVVSAAVVRQGRPAATRVNHDTQEGEAMKIMKSKKGLALLAVLAIVAVSAVGAYA